MRVAATRLIVALLGACLALSAGPSGAAAVARQGTEDRLQLAGETSFSSSRSGRWRIYVPHDVALEKLRISYGGDGRVAGFLVIEEGHPVGQGVLLGGYSVGRCHGRGCDARPLHKFQFSANADGYLPAGPYFVYILADAAPVRLRVEAEELTGSVRVREPKPVRTHIATLPTTGPPTSNVYSAGGFAPPDHDSLFALFGLWLEADAYAASAYGDCFYFDGDSYTRDEVAFQPGCPTGDGFHHTFVGSDPTKPGEVALVSARLSPRLTISGIGGWYGAAGSVTARGAVGAWMDVRSE